VQSLTFHPKEGRLNMKLFHCTTDSAAQQIMARGFRDGRLSGIVGSELRGVSLSAVPIDQNQGAKGNIVIEVTVPNSIDLHDFAVQEERLPTDPLLPGEVPESMPVWEWLVPSSVVNAWPRRQLSTDEADAL
jgi:hypothetical protein